MISMKSLLNRRVATVLVITTIILIVVIIGAYFTLNSKRDQMPNEKASVLLSDDRYEADYPRRNYDIYPENVRSLIREVDILKDKCRGGSGDDPATWRECETLDVRGESLRKRGWCWGPDDAFGYQKTWMTCETAAPAKLTLDQAWLVGAWTTTSDPPVETLETLCATENIIRFLANGTWEGEIEDGTFQVLDGEISFQTTRRRDEPGPEQKEVAVSEAPSVESAERRGDLLILGGNPYVRCP
jgi:hypothetical protein